MTVTKQKTATTKTAAKKTTKTAAKKTTKTAAKTAKTAAKKTAAKKTAAKTAKTAAKKTTKTPKTKTLAKTSSLDPRDHLAAVDPRLGKHIARVGAYGLVPEGLTSVYESLARSIVYQQLTGKAAATIYGRLEKLGKDGLPTPVELLSIDDAALRGVGLSGSKARALRDLADRQHKGLLPGADEAALLDDDTLIEQLSAVRGIGPWSVQMLLMFRLGRPDVLPSTDYGVQKGFQKVYRTKTLPTPKELLAFGERWRPHRSMASWYLWRALDT